jgi:UDP-N-acetylmuramoylalanine--D-glutamate ligase
MIRLQAYKNRTLGVFGLGKAGKAAVEAAFHGGASVFAWDDSEISRKGLQGDARFKSGNLYMQHPSGWPWEKLAGVVMSPGVPLTHPKPHPVVDMAKQHRVRLLGEVDLLHEACPDARYIGITGTNGKSTTTALLGHVLQQNGVPTQVGGNLGVPALALQELGEGGHYVLEMSSYQLDLCQTVVFDVSVLLNLAPDHLDRHGDMAGYIGAKRRIFERQTDQSAAFVGLDDGFSRDLYIELVREHRPHLIPFSATQPAQGGKSLRVDEKGILEDKLGEAPVRFDLKQIQRLKGRHNWQNIAAAYGVARYLGLKPEGIMQAVQGFAGLPHRLEMVQTIGAATFINDSKATNADAAQRALEPFERIYWIAGGKPKAGGIVPLAPYYPHIVHAFLIGEAQDDFAATLEGKVPYTKCGDLKTATETAARFALRDATPSVVLLSPACASFDQWANFEVRGDAFRAFVQELAQKGI